MRSSRKPLLLARADAGTRQGTGHVMRSLALAREWRIRGGEVWFLTCRPDAAIRRRIESCDARVIELESAHPDVRDVEMTISHFKLAAKNSAVTPWLALDGYHFDTRYQRTCRNAGAKLLAIDDTAHLPWYDADMVLNHSQHAEKLDYKCAARTKLLLGTHYALIRREFLARSTTPKQIAPLAQKILVTLGGSDAENATLKMIQALGLIDCPLETRIVVGPVNPHREILRRETSRSKTPMALEINPDDMPALMQWADLAITAAGGTCWELCCLGVPMVTLVVAQNQEPIAEAFAAAGVSANLGWHHRVSLDGIATAVREMLDSPARRTEMSSRGKALVDGHGASRVVDLMLRETGVKAA